MKKLAFIYTSLILVSCSSDDLEPPSIDMTLLYGQWFEVGLCETQNNITFNENGTYLWVSSFNTCEENNNDTYQYTGTYTVTGNRLILNQETETIIEEGVIPSDTFEPVRFLVNRRITEISDNSLTIQNEYNLEPILVNRNFEK